MKYCDKCKIKVNGKRERCPLCQAQLRSGVGTAEEIFPHIQTNLKKHSTFFKILVLVSVAAVVITVLINFMFHECGWWSLFVVGGVFCVWLCLIVLIRKRKNIPKTILYQVVIVSILAVLWDLLTGFHRWSLDFVLPIILISAMIAMAVIAKVMRLCTGDYMIYLVMDGLFGVIPILFLLGDVVHVRFPSVVCVAFSILSLTAFLLFEGRNIALELKKRFHL